MKIIEYDVEDKEIYYIQEFYIDVLEIAKILGKVKKK